jgi:ABC-type dipeptide/oligopeptide/nickel transport system permease component
MDHPQLALVDHFAEAAVALLSFMFVGVNLAVDILYAWLDPRISYT